MIATRLSALPTSPAIRLAPATTAAVRSPFDVGFTPTDSTAVTTAPALVTQTAAEPTRGLSLTSFVLGAVAAVVIVGAVGVGTGQIPTSAAPAPTSSEISVPPGMTTDQAQSQFDALRYLDNVGAKSGGGLSRQLLGVWDQKVTPQKALDTLAQGDPIVYRESKDAVPHQIHSFQELDDLRNQVREQQIKNAIDQGLGQIQHGLDNLGNIIRDGVNR